MDDKDIYRSAMVLINKHGKDARKEAALMGLKHADNLDAHGLSAWCQIVEAISVLQNKDRSSCIH